MQHAFGDAALLEFGEIKACAEMVSVADKHNGLDLFQRPTEPTLEREDGFVIERIALARPREMDDGDRVLQLHTNVGEIICTGGRHRAINPSHLFSGPHAYRTPSMARRFRKTRTGTNREPLTPVCPFVAENCRAGKQARRFTAFRNSPLSVVLSGARQSPS
jgi:hypothetical protein